MKIKEFWEDHKEQIVMTTLAVSSFAFGYWLCKSHSKKVTVSFGDNSVNALPDKMYQSIDEDIFTNIAPWIEDAVIAEGVDEDLFETVYHVPQPKYGDWSKGVYEELKKVKVYVQDITPIE